MVTGGGDRGGPRVKIKWPVTIKTEKGSMEGVTLDLGTDGAFVSCAKPLRLNDVFDMVITAPEQDIEVTAEVIWSNIYGPDDDITPRGMGVLFLSISGKDLRAIAKAALEHLRSGEMDPRAFEAFQTLIMAPDEVSEK
jgi:hypothetical protein